MTYPEAPFPQRSSLMSLDVIRPEDIPVGRIYNYKIEDLSLKTADIEKCQPFYRANQYLDKPNLQVGITDSGFDGSRARTYYAPINRPRDLSLTTADIEYAQPKNVRAKGHRVTDPVCPVYDFPKSAPIRPVTPLRFNGRETNDVSDIELTYPTKVIPDRNYVKDPNDISDIEYASPNYERRVAHPLHNLNFSTSLNVRDISGSNKTRPRETNPLDPVYNVSQTTTTSLHRTWNEEKDQKDCMRAPPLQPAEIGPVPGSKPRKLTWQNGEPQFSLLREDIPGAVPQRWTGSIPFNIYDPPEKKAVISFHDPHDIPGAQVGSLRKGIETNRSLNPLQPTYQFLDGKIVPTTVYKAQNAFDAERGFPMRKCASEAALSRGEFSHRSAAGESVRSAGSGNLAGLRKTDQQSVRSAGSARLAIDPQSNRGGTPPGLGQNGASSRGSSAKLAGHLVLTPDAPTLLRSDPNVPTLTMKRSPSVGGSVPQSTRSVASIPRSLQASRSNGSLTRYQQLDQFVSK